MKESRTLEFKETITQTFLKTVSAYANYGTGEIRFGISDDGKELGVSEAEKACLDIENRINDSIEPRPDFNLHIDKETSVITLTVFEGLHKPYLYKARAYKRNDTSTVAVDRIELTRLIMTGQNLTFEETPAAKQDLTFKFLGEKMSAALNLETFTKDTLKTLELYSEKKGFNKAGELLSDENGFPGVDIVRFGDSISIIHDRETHERESILKLYDDALSMYRKYYQYEQISGSVRETVSLIPEAAFREVVANALVHRTWDVAANVHIAMFPEKIEVVSPGGLPSGMNREEYLRGGISILRNRIVANVFFRLHLIERFGTGIRRINELYKSSEIKPVYDVTENSIRVVLPVISLVNDLSKDENDVYRLLKGRAASSSDVVRSVGFGKSKVNTILKKLVAEGYVETTGSGRGLKYTAER
ncbi:MAG: putative DNA binding domain-containing protein [Clostridia bacterium]|nr:putative DNA binding domain-containing protein [Clostridia bacterium]